MSGAVRGLVALLASALLIGSAVDLGAQEAGAPPDSAVVDSTRIRILEAARRLSRGPVPDSLIPRLADSARVAAEARGDRRGGLRSGAGGRGGAGDSVAQALMALEGYSLTRYEGEEARFDTRTRRLVLLTGDGTRARVLREGMELSADSSVTYDEGAGRIRTEGGGTYTPDEGDPVESRTMVYDLAQNRGTALEAETTYSQGAQWIMHGDLTSVSQDASYGHRMRFTSCELEIPHYHFQTGEIKIIAGDVLVARPVKLYFGDVPVAWLPFMAQGLGQGRSSGILPPRFSVNDIVQTSGGQSRRISNVGFYWAMSQYSDAQVALDWFSGNFLALTGRVRYHWMRQFLRGDLSLRRFWRDEGGTEFALDTRHSWQINERTSFRTRASFASSTDFVRRNSFDPRELTQTIDSDAGLNRRFDWGNLSLSWNRRQSLSDGQINSTLPSANLSLSTITLFPAPASRASWYNNLTWSGGVSLNRRLRSFDQDELPDTAGFSPSTADRINTQLGANSTVTMGSFNFSQRLSLSEAVTKDVPPGNSLFPDSTESGDFSEAELDWSLSLDYQQRLIGSTTITPSLSLNGKAKRTDELERAGSLVSAPTRLSFGARLKTDMYRFLPGFGPYAQVRHKVSPSFDYQYAPSVLPTDLQTEVFGARESQAQNQISIGMNQTFEAKVAEEEADSADAPEEGERPDTATGPRRPERAEIVNLLSIQTSAVRYDFVQADSLGDFQSGFTTTRLRNSIDSDFLRGMSVSMEHDIFQGAAAEERSFDPHLSQLNLNFSFGARSALFQWLGRLAGAEPEPEAAPEEEDEALDEEMDLPGRDRDQDESRIIPGMDERGLSTSVRRRTTTGAGRGGRGGGAWNANLSYSLNRPRADQSQNTQMLQANFSFAPTEHWDMNWRTSYDVENGAFNDHVVSLTRDLHRWEATFDFRQTAAGNWSFRFEVALTDNRDLKFDYQQRQIEDRSSGFDRRRF